MITPTDPRRSGAAVDENVSPMTRVRSTLLGFVVPATGQNEAHVDGVIALFLDLLFRSPPGDGIGAGDEEFAPGRDEAVGVGMKGAAGRWGIGVRIELAQERVPPVGAAFAGRQSPRGHLQGGACLWPAVFGGVTAHVRGPIPRVRGPVPDDAVNGIALTPSLGARDLGRFAGHSFPFSARRGAVFGGVPCVFRPASRRLHRHPGEFLPALPRDETNLLSL